MVPNHARYQLRYTRMQLSYYRALSPACQEEFSDEGEPVNLYS